MPATATSNNYYSSIATVSSVHRQQRHTSFGARFSRRHRLQGPRRECDWRGRDWLAWHNSTMRTAPTTTSNSQPQNDRPSRSSKRNSPYRHAAKRKRLQHQQLQQDPAAKAAAGPALGAKNQIANDSTLLVKPSTKDRAAVNREYACTRLVCRPTSKHWVNETPRPLHQGSVDSTSFSAATQRSSSERRGSNALVSRSPQSKLRHLQAFLNEDTTDSESESDSDSNSTGESEGESRSSNTITQIQTAPQNTDGERPQGPITAEATSPDNTDETVDTPSLDDESGDSPDTNYFQSPRRPSLDFETTAPLHPTKLETPRLLDCEDIDGAIDDVSNEIFYLIGLTSNTQIPTQYPNMQSTSPRPAKHARHISVNETDDLKVEPSPIPQHLDDVTTDSSHAQQTSRKKRKMTGITSKHFSPVKPSRSPSKLKQDSEQGSEHIEQLPDACCLSPPKASDTVQSELTKSSPSKRKTTGTKSHHFLPLHLLDRVDLPQPGRGRGPAGVSIAPVPSIQGEHFGIIQEKLWREPFWLIIAVIMLNKTTGRAAIPTFWALRARWPTVQALSEADPQDVCAMIQHCGLQTSRSKNMVACARVWLADPPALGRRHRTLHYPCHGDGMAYSRNVVVVEDAENCAGAVEIAHLPGCGAYAFDSWRIFCRDVCRGVAEDYNGRGATAEDFQPEWKRVLPRDKELRATLRWMWLKESHIWDCETGHTRPATAEELECAVQGEMHVADADERRFAARAAGVELTPKSRVKGVMKAALPERVKEEA